jgi:hypothetical protein
MKVNVIPNAFTPSTGLVDFSNIDGFDIRRLLAVINPTTRAVIYDPVTPGLGYLTVTNSIVDLALDTSSQGAGDKIFGVYDYPDRNVGIDWSANEPVYPNVGSNFNSSAPFANYIHLNTVPRNLARSNITVQNLSGAQVVVLLDDGTASVGALPVNATAIVLTYGSGSGSPGQIWSSTTFKGRLQCYAASSSAFVSVSEH